MKYLVIFYCLSLFFFSASAQPLATNKNLPGPVGTTYAVIIGISSYWDQDIEQLEFSNRDAVFFANFLMSVSGGSVPKEQIKLLIDAGATTGEVEKALQWLKDNCKKDDKVYFYFSGHGALENLTMNEDGYLICYNTTSVAFVNMGFSIDRLNGFANTLSIKNKANVIIITDACHSGKMAGNNFKGNNLVGEQLMAVKQKEIRMASCAHDQLSKENRDWGGGRGVFSYHLINGLHGGLADKGKDGVVTLGELKTYMDSAMANDAVLKRNGEVQTPVIPVIKDNQDVALSKVVEAEAIKIRQQVKDDSVTNAMMTEAMRINEEERLADPEEYFLYLLEKEDLESLTNSLRLDSVAADEIAFMLINKIASSQPAEKAIKLEELKAILKDSERFRRFKVSLGRFINDKVQYVIGQYIKGDEAELERRRYYNSNNKDYDIYPKMLAAALKLSESEEDLIRSTSVLLHYFKGVTIRLKINRTQDPKLLIEEALIEQKKALALEEHAAYIYNELGILYQYKNKNTEAEKYFVKATQFSPGWAIPHSNLCGLYASTGKYEKAIAACHIADSIHHAPDSLKAALQSVSINQGFINERTGNLLIAEEYYHNTIEINSRHYLPFERLGYVNMMTTNYARADSFFYEADLRTKGFHFKGNAWDRFQPEDMDGSPYSPPCAIDTLSIKPTDIFAFFTWGMQEYYMENYTQAVRILKKVIALDKNNPLVFHYLGKIFYDQRKWEEAEQMFTYAITYHLNKERFTSYVDSVKNSVTYTSVTYTYENRCFEDYFRKMHYEPNEDYYFAGTIYELWKHPEEAELYFKKLIQNWPEDMGGYIKLCMLFEKQGRYAEAEQLLNNYGAFNKEQSERELYAFYKRMIEQYPKNGEWPYRLGLLLYSRAARAALKPYLDSIVWFSLYDKEIFINVDLFNTLDSYLLMDQAGRGSPGLIRLPQLIKPESGDYYLPGTRELVSQGEAIYTPRKDGIKYLSMALELISERETRADIHLKIGNIYVWAGSKKQAAPFYERSLELVPDNANTRLKLIDMYRYAYKNRAAMTQMNYLLDSSQINFNTRLLLAKFNMHAGYFEKADKILDETETVYTDALPEITELRGRLTLLADQYKEAIAFYQKYTKTDLKNAGTAYTLARLYAKTGKYKEAWEWLEKALNKGFNYSFVLQKDPFMDKLRQTPKWQTTIKNFSLKKYSSGETAD